MMFCMMIFDWNEIAGSKGNSELKYVLSRACNDLPFWKWLRVTDELQK